MGCNSNDATSEDQHNDSIPTISSDTITQSGIPDSLKQAMDSYADALLQGDSTKVAETAKKLEQQILNRDYTVNAIQIEFDEVVIQLNTLIEEHGLEDKINDPNHEIAKLQNKISRTMRKNTLSADEQKVVLLLIAELKKLVQQLEASIKATK